jgi:hypothetical protein
VFHFSSPKKYGWGKCRHSRHSFVIGCIGQNPYRSVLDRKKFRLLPLYRLSAH